MKMILQVEWDTTLGYYTGREPVKARSIHSHFPSELTLNTEDCTKAPSLSCCCWTGSTSSSQMQKCLHNNLKQGRRLFKATPREKHGFSFLSPLLSSVSLCLRICSPHKSHSSATDVSAPICWAPDFFATTCCPWNFSCLFKSLTRKAKEPNWGP